VLTCPNDITVSNDDGFATATVDYTVTPDTASCDKASGAFFPLGTTDVFCTYFEPVGAVDETCAFAVIVEDTVDPVLTCPANIAETTDAGLDTGLVKASSP
jgi:hypothetical protein